MQARLLTEAASGMESYQPHGEKSFWTSRLWWRRTGLTSLGLIVAAGFSLATTIVVARALGPAQYGLVILASSVAALIARFLDFTLEEGVVYHGSRAIADQDWSGLLRLLRIALILDLLIGLMVAGTVVLASEALAGLLSLELPPSLLRIATLIPLAATADGATGSTLLLAGRPDLRGWALAIGALARLGAVLVAVLVGGVIAVLLAFAAGSAIGGMCQAFLAWRAGWRTWARRAQGRSRASVSVSASVLRLIRFGAVSSLSSSVSNAETLLIPVLIGVLVGPAAVGFLDVAMLPISIAALGTMPLRMSLLPEQARLWAEQKRDTLRQSIRTYIRWTLALGAVGAAIGWLILPWLIPILYSSRFQDAISPARVMTIAAVATLVTGWAKTLPAAVGRPGVRVWISTFQLVLTGLLLTLLSRYGTVGAAIAIAGGYMVSAVVWGLAVNRLVPREGTMLPPSPSPIARSGR
jgi:O-antigen/teichoic acid export membrane protein